MPLASPPHEGCDDDTRASTSSAELSGTVHRGDIVNASAAAAAASLQLMPESRKLSLVSVKILSSVSVRTLSSVSLNTLSFVSMKTLSFVSHCRAVVLAVFSHCFLLSSTRFFLCAQK